jgi:hypothetical protein
MPTPFSGGCACRATLLNLKGYGRAAAPQPCRWVHEPNVKGSAQSEGHRLSDTRVEDTLIE